MDAQLLKILNAFAVGSVQSINPLGNGLINTTYKVVADNEFVLQKINTAVFKNATAIFHNQHVLENFLQKNNSAYKIVPTCKTIAGDIFYTNEQNDYYRVSPFIQNSHTKDVVQNAEQAYEAASAFGKFTCAFKNIDATKLQTVIPAFHNITLRYNQFLVAIKHGNRTRILECDLIIKKLLDNVDIANKYEAIAADRNWKTRVTHHDTKISNVLFNAENIATHVIDLDTVMPGHFISDVGDMMRTYLSPVSEEEADVEKIIIRKDIYQAIYTGYNEAMQNELTVVEKNNFLYAGKFMIYMQALRFCTDYLNDDIYYGAKYEQHNYVRACNQINLLEKLLEFEKAFNY
jgi:Ser/Thr protein kinase RdoA (MazF antagonist)